MKKLFIVRLFLTIMLTALMATQGYSGNNNKNFNLSAKQTPAAKPAVAQVKPPQAFHSLPKKPTKADSALMRDKTLNGQYKYLLTKVYHYQEPFITSLYRNLRDTMNADRKKLQEAEIKLAAQTKSTADLQTDVTQKERSLAESNTRVNSVNLLGMYIDKSTYNLIMWGLVLVFGITAFVVIARSGSHSREARYRINLYNELEEEFKTYKAKANEKEKKLARELQTERNKVDELMGRG